MNGKSDNTKDWLIVGGTTMIGLGIGFIFLQTSALIMVACIIIGVGAGLVMQSVLSYLRRK